MSNPERGLHAHLPDNKNYHKTFFQNNDLAVKATSMKISFQ
jgi:hypothetical protein